MAFLPAGAAPDADHIAAELELCVALAGWDPWSAPTAPLLRAKEQVQCVRGAGPAAVCMATACERRAEAIMELAYEDTHSEQLPVSFRYQWLARVRLRGCTQWSRRARGRNLTSQYWFVSAGIQSVAALNRGMAKLMGQGTHTAGEWSGCLPPRCTIGASCGSLFRRCSAESIC